MTIQWIVSNTTICCFCLFKILILLADANTKNIPLISKSKHWWIRKKTLSTKNKLPLPRWVSNSKNISSFMVFFNSLCMSNISRSRYNFLHYNKYWDFSISFITLYERIVEHFRLTKHIKPSPTTSAGPCSGHIVIDFSFITFITSSAKCLALSAAGWLWLFIIFYFRFFD